MSAYGKMAEVRDSISRIKLALEWFPRTEFNVDRQSGKLDTVMHEALHVATKCDPSPELHKLIYQISPELVRLLRENPKLVDYLAGRPVVAPSTKPARSAAKKVKP